MSGVRVGVRRNGNVQNLSKSQSASQAPRIGRRENTISKHLVADLLFRKLHQSVNPF